MGIVGKKATRKKATRKKVSARTAKQAVVEAPAALRAGER